MFSHFQYEDTMHIMYINKIIEFKILWFLLLSKAQGPHAFIELNLISPWIKAEPCLLKYCQFLLDENHVVQ